MYSRSYFSKIKKLKTKKNNKNFRVIYLAFVTYGHHALVNGNRRGSIIGIFLTILFAVIFTILQYVEYSEAAFTMSDSVYGSAFYASTGLHGLTLAVPIKFINININLCPTVKK